MYEIGDTVICKSGVRRVADIRTNQAFGLEYTLASLEDEQDTLAAPKAEIIRKALPKEQLLELIARIPYIKTIQAPNDKIRKTLYEDAIKKYEELEWVQIIKTVYLRSEEKRLMPEEAAFSDSAKAFFHGEIAGVMSIPFNQVEAYIADIISGDTW